MFSAKKALAVCLALCLIVLTGCGIGEESHDYQHPALSYEGQVYRYGMEIDTEKLQDKHPGMTVSGNRCTLGEGTTLLLRENAETDAMILVGYSISEGSTGSIGGVKVGDTAQDFLTAFPGASLIDENAEALTPIFYVHDGQVYSHAAYQEKLNALRLEGTEAYMEFLAQVLICSALEIGDTLGNVTYGDYNAIYYNK